MLDRARRWFLLSLASLMTVAMAPKRKTTSVTLTAAVNDRVVTLTIAAKPAFRTAIDHYLLEWGDGHSVGLPGAPPSSISHTYDVYGTFRPRITAWDSAGGWDWDDVLLTLSAPVVIPPPDPVPLPPPSDARPLLGGWRIVQEFARGAIAIDFSRMKLWMIGHAQRNEVCEYDLPPMGSGADLNAWPAVSPTRIIPGWWPSAQGYGHGLVFWRGKVWVAPRVFYAIAEAGDPLTIYADDGETMAFPSLLRQVFSGFVKTGPGLDPFIGGGGYESGQGTVSGPTLATLGGQRLIEYQWPGDPGAGTPPANWDLRAPRDPNYYPVNHVDTWVAWEPRLIDGQLQGRWAVDCIYGGGLVLPEGICYWPYMGTGDLDYARQKPTFAAYGLERTYEYRYDAGTHQLTGYAPRPDVGSLPVTGQEIGPDGKVYLAVGNAWTSGAYQADVALQVFG